MPLSVRIIASLVCLLTSTCWLLDARSDGPAPPGLYVAPFQDATAREADPEPDVFRLINYFFTRFTATNQLPDPSGLRGVSLGPIGVGDGVASGTSVGKDTDALYIEQRWIPVFEYSPLFADGFATFRAQLEVDFTWGVAANAVQNNQGGGFNADQVNIQTKNVNVSLYPTRKAKQLSIVIGTQSFYDTIYDPAITSLFDIVKTGYKLTFLGTDATGFGVYTNTPYGIAKVSFVPIGGAQPDKALDGDARFKYAYLFTFDYAFEFQPGTVAGLTYWYLADDTQGKAFVFEGLVNSGPGSGGLSGFVGTQRFNLDDPTGHVHYFGAHFHHNINFKTADFGASGYLMYNLGEFENNRENSQRLAKVDVGGLAANLELLYNWGFSDGDVITLEGLFATGDSNPNDDTYSSPFTMNYYGLPGAVWFNHKTLILFPFTSVINNYTGGVVDISNQGYGLVTGILTGAWDIIPNTLNLKLGTAFASSVADPVVVTEGVDRGSVVGTEVNAELKYHIRYLMTVGIHFGYLFKGDFYDGNPEVTEDPWAVYNTFTWYAF